MKKKLMVLLAIFVLAFAYLAQAAVITPSFDATLSSYLINPAGSAVAVTSYTLQSEGTIYTSAPGEYMAQITGGQSGSVMSSTLSANAGDVFQFYWLFDATDYLPINDFAFHLFSSTKDFYFVQLSDVQTVGNYGNSGWNLFSYTFTNNSNGTVLWEVFDQFDNILHPVLLISASAPVPEPSTLLLLGAGMIGLGFLRKRQ